MNPRRFIVLLVLLPLLSACAAQAIHAATPTAPAPASPRDGEWRGQGVDSEDRPFTLTLSIRGDRLTGFLYSFPGSDGLTCTGIDYGQLPTESQMKIEETVLNASLGDDQTLTASFPGDESASGHLTLHWHDRQPRCNGDYEVDWTAVKQAPPTNSSAQTPQPKLPHPFATLFQILIFGLSNGAVLALNAIGVTIIYSTVRTLNLAHGDVFALTTALVTSLVNAFALSKAWPPLQLAGALVLVLLAAAGAGALLSMGVDQFGFKPFRGSSRLAPLIATLGLSFILFQGALVWRTFQGSWIPGEHRSVPGIPEVPTDGIPSLLPEINLAAKLGISNLVVRFSDLLVVGLAIFFVLLATWFLNRTRTGRAIQALAQNTQAAQILGINVDATIRRAFAVGGAFAGAAGFIFALYYSRPFGAHGAQSGLLAFAAALLGGIGSPVGALLSGLTIGVVSSLSDYYLSAQWTPVLMLALLVALLAWRPHGLTASGAASAVLGAESAGARDSVLVTGAGSGSRTQRWLILLLAALGLFPILAQVFGWGGQVILRSVEVFILLTLGLNLALGLAGLLDFGFAASFGLGAYAGALLSRFDATIALLAGMMLAGLLGWLKGALAHRLRGDFLAVATLTLGLLVRQVVINLPTVTGGAGGLGGFPALHFIDFGVVSPAMKFYLVYGVVLLAALASRRLIDSRTGRAWVASSEDESAALAAGVDVGRARMWAFVFSSALAGLAGVLYAGTLSYVDPETMSFHVSSMILTMVILGGAGSVPGAILGAAAIVLYDKVIVPQLADLLALIWPSGLAIGSAPDIRGASFFNFGIALYLTVLIRARRRNKNA
jgi:branched-chain amino acid transport system permease protein